MVRAEQRNKPTGKSKFAANFTDVRNRSSNKVRGLEAASLFSLISLHEGRSNLPRYPWGGPHVVSSLFAFGKASVRVDLREIDHEHM